MSAFRAETYRAQMRRLLLLAPTMQDAQSKSMLLNLADEYHDMALRSDAEEDGPKTSSSGGSWLNH